MIKDTTSPSPVNNRLDSRDFDFFAEATTINPTTPDGMYRTNIYSNPEINPYVEADMEVNNFLYRSNPALANTLANYQTNKVGVITPWHDFCHQFSAISTNKRSLTNTEAFSWNLAYSLALVSEAVISKNLRPYEPALEETRIDTLRGIITKLDEQYISSDDKSSLQATVTILVSE